MSLQIYFEEHSWYMGFAIRHQNANIPANTPVQIGRYEWAAVIDNGNTYQIDTVEADTLSGLKAQIREYHLCKHNGYGERIAARRLEELRTELQAERISYGELAELWKLHEYIKEGDTELLEAAGVPENA